MSTKTAAIALGVIRSKSVRSTVENIQFVHDVNNTISSPVTRLLPVVPSNSSNIKTATQIAISIASARLDYCNLVLYTTSQSNISKLQRAQNSLAQVVTNTR